MSLTETAFGQLMRLYGRERPDFVTFDEGPTVLATRFAADEAVSAALAAGGTVAADLWALRAGETQRVDVATREAAASLTSYAFVRIEDPAHAVPARDPAVLRSPVMGFHPTKDGRHVLLHPSFPPGTERILRALGCAADADEVRATCRSRTALEIEDAVAAERGCAGVVRTPQEWDASEQGRQLAAHPPVEVIKIADSPPEPMPDAGDMPLSRVRVLDLTRVLAGPTCARTLAQYGADVLYLASPKLPASLGFLPDTNHGKLSAWLDLDEAAGRERLTELLRGADVFSQGYRTGAMERMGLHLDQLLRPRGPLARPRRLGTAGPDGHRHGAGARRGRRPAAAARRGDRLHYRLPRRLRQPDRAAAAGAPRRQLPRTRLALPDRHVGAPPWDRGRGPGGACAQAGGRRDPRLPRRQPRWLRADDAPASSRPSQRDAGQMETPGCETRDASCRVAGAARARRRPIVTSATAWPLSP
jgi:crotonobetainyl-CoA:carnitine CoA-transferase CaiB-like acyl-CoA transferase